MITQGVTVGEMCVAEVMRRGPVTVLADTPARDLARLLAFEEIGGVPVVDAAGKAVGVVSAADLVRLTAEAEPSAAPALDGPAGWQAVHRLPGAVLDGYRVADLMTPATLSVRLETTLAELARFLLRAGVHRALVHDGEGRPVGIVTATDVLRAVAGDLDGPPADARPEPAGAGAG